MKNKTVDFMAHFTARELLSYAWVGLVGVALDVVFFKIFIHALSFTPVLATTLSAILAGSLTFPLNQHFTFQKTDNARTRFAYYAVINIAGIVLGALMMYIGNTILKIPADAMKALIVVVVAGVQYLLNKFVAFK